jgi:hypothetical protein
MTAATKSTRGSVLRGVAWLLFVIAAGGRAINEFAGTERMLAEAEGIGLAVVFAALGVVLESAGKRVSEREAAPSPASESTSDEAPRQQ